MHNLSVKDMRSLDRDISVLRKKDNYDIPLKSADYAKFSLFDLNFQHQQHKYYLRDNSKKAFRRVVEACYKYEYLDRYATNNDIYQVVKIVVEDCVLSDVKISSIDFLNKVKEKIFLDISEYTHFCRVKGLKLDGMESLVFGGYTIKKIDSKFIENIYEGSNEESFISSLVKEYGGQYIITATHKGTHERTKKIFYEESKIVLSVLLLYFSICFRGIFGKVYLNLCNHLYRGFEPGSSISYSSSNKPIYSGYFNSKQDISFGRDDVEFLEKYYFMKCTPSILFKDEKNEVEEAISRSIYWFGEALKEDDNTSSFIKLWSCAEAFFSIENKEIVDKNAKGITGLLLFGHYDFDYQEKYKDVIAKIKYYYKLRSKSVHRGKYTDVSVTILNDFCYIMSCIIVSIISLHFRGYNSLYDVQVQSNKLYDAQVISS